MQQVNKTIKSFILLLLLIPLNLIGQLKDYEDSYKRLIQRGVIDKSKAEYYDSINNIYSNFYYGFSYKKPKNWQNDNGSGMVSVFRTYNYDSFINLSVNVLKNSGKDMDISSHEYFDSIGEEELVKKTISHLKSLGQNIKSMTIKKTFYKNIPATYSVSEQIIKEDDSEVVIKNISNQFFSKQMQFTIGLSVPEIFYEIKPDYYDSLFYNFSLIQTFNNNEFIDEKEFIINGIDIREVDTYQLKSMIKVFLDDCISNNNIKLLPNKIEVIFEPLDSPILGLSYGMKKDDIIFIKIDPKGWAKASLTKKWYLIYHELGHDVLNLEHGEGGKMMFNFIDRKYSWKEFFQDKNDMFNYYNKNL